MKPNFALSLSFEGIKLLHRAAGGWREVGEVSVNAQDLSDELAMLRKSAAGLEPAGVRSKLIIPSSQIKYLTLETPEQSDEQRRETVEAALEDATPYTIAELAYDISQDGDLTHVAAVAKETLDEAEAFANEHRFHPVCFVTIPGDAPYLGEPFFGATKTVSNWLEAGEEVEPDGIAVVIVGAIAAPPQATDLPGERDAALTQARATDTSETKPEDIRKDSAHAPDTTDAVSNAASPHTAGTDNAASTDVTAGAAARSSTEESGPTVDTKPEKPSPKSPDTPDTNTSGIARGSAGDADPKPPTQAQSASQDVTPARARALAAAAAGGHGAPLSAPKKVSASELLETADAVKTGFSSRRHDTATLSKPVGGAQRLTISTPPQPDSSSLSQPAPVAPVAKAAKTGFFSRRTPRRGAAAPVPAPTASVATVKSEAERMTVFGARSDAVGGKPRFLGLILTVVLLVFLAGVAAWAAVFLDDGLASLIRKDGGRATASAPENQVDPEIIRLPESSEIADAVEAQDIPEVEDTQIAALDPVLSAEDSAVLNAFENQLPEPELQVITPQEAAARYAVSGIWPLAPLDELGPSQTVFDPAYRSSIDAPSAARDALALPAVRNFETDTELAAVVSPPPFGQRVTLDADGLIIPTEEGVVTPQGYTLIAASPPRKPPLERTQAVEAAVEAAQARSPLLDFRPKNRPLGLAEQVEREQLGGVSRSELANFRPAVRPASIQERAEQAERRAAEEEEEAARRTIEERAIAAAGAAAAAALAQAPASVPDPLADATRLATAQSLRPDTRPRNFERIVSRAQSAPAATETRVAAVASVAPRTVAPSIPSKASVARSATVKNAINLRRVNLIGVYGKPASRRALVRLANGRYQKVKVGDRIDGGRVAAIGNSELRYTKGGRNVVLEMP